MTIKVGASTQTINVMPQTAATIVRREQSPTIQLVTQQSPVKQLTQIYGQLPQSADRLGTKFFQDTQYTLEAPLYCPANVKTQIPDNGQGLLTTGFGANGTKWLNQTSGRFYPDALGDCFLYRVNFTIMPTLNNKSLLITFEIGSPNPVYNERETITTGAGVAKPMSKLILAQAGPSMVLNGGAAYVTPEMDCYISKISVLVDKTYSASLR